MSNLEDKINFILAKFNDPKEFARYGINKNYKAKLWNMDTSVLGILEQMKLNISTILSPIDRIEVRHMGFNKNNNSLFSLFIDEVNVTPSRKKKEVSDAAIRQYLQVLSSLGVVMFGNTSTSKMIGFYGVSAGFRSTIYDYNNSEMIKRLIIFCLKRNIGYSRNLAFSIFIFALNFYKYDFTKIDINNREIEKPRNKDGVKFFDITGKYGDLYLLKDYTYKSLIKSTLKHEAIEKFVNNIFEILEDKNESDDFSSEILWKNYLSTLNKARSKFKDSIKANREILNLYNEHENIYSDIISIDNSIDGLACKFNELNAAHIYNVWQIKNDLKQAFETENNDESQIKEIIGCAKNPYNGLMMNSQYHDYFDRNLFTFNINGQMIYREEDKDYLFNTLKMKEVRINSKILNEEMKNFLSIRKF